MIVVNARRFRDAYDISYMYHLRRLVGAGVTCNCVWRTTVEEWTDRPGHVFLPSGTNPKDAPNRVPFVDDVLCWVCLISSSANVPPTCGRCGDSAWRLSCVYGGQWKRAFRVNTRVVHLAVSHRVVRSARRSVYNCFTLAAFELFIGIFLFRV